MSTHERLPRFWRQAKEILKAALSLFSNDPPRRISCSRLSELIRDRLQTRCNGAAHQSSGTGVEGIANKAIKPIRISSQTLWTHLSSAENWSAMTQHKSKWKSEHCKILHCTCALAQLPYQIESYLATRRKLNTFNHNEEKGKKNMWRYPAVATFS